MAKGKRSTEGYTITETFSSITRLRKGFFLAYRILLIFLVISLIVDGIKGNLESGKMFLALLVAGVSSIIYLISLAFEMYLKSDLIATQLGKDQVETRWNGVRTGSATLFFRSTDPTYAEVWNGNTKRIFKLHGEELDKTLKELIEVLGSNQAGENDG